MHTERNSWLISEDKTLLAECTLDFHKASGKGGQKVNKTSSAVRLIHKPSGISVTSAESRSQTENRFAAIRKLRMKIALTLRLDVSPDSPCPQFEPAPALKNPAYPMWAALVLDHLHSSKWDVKSCAEKFGVSTSALLKLLSRDTELWQELSRGRQAAGLHVLKVPN